MRTNKFPSILTIILVMFLVFTNNKAYSQNTCGTAVSISPNPTITFIPCTSTDSVYFLTMNSGSSDTNIQVVTLSSIPLGTTGAHCHEVVVFTGTCGHLALVNAQYLPEITGENEMRLDLHLLPYTTYYIVVGRVPVQGYLPGCNPSSSGECNPLLAWNFSICCRSVHTFIPQDSGSESPSISNLFYEARGQIQDNRHNPVLNLTAYTNFSSPATYFTDTAVSFVMARTNATMIDTFQRVDMSLTGSALQTPQRMFKMEENFNAGYLNYFYGFVPTGVPAVFGYARLLYQNVYNNIDEQIYSNSAGIKVYFVCNPGGTGGAGDPNNIEIKFVGANSVNVTSNGGLNVVTDAGSINFPPADAYEDSANNIVQLPWKATFTAVASNIVKFNIGAYNTGEPLIIRFDRGHLPPPGGTNNLDWSSFCGGKNTYPGDAFNAVCTDASGNVIATGGTYSNTFPHTTGFLQDTSNGFEDAVVVKWSLGTKLLWATYYGGGGNDQGNSITTDAKGNVFFTGYTYSGDFPILKPNTHAYCQKYFNNLASPGCTTGDGDAFVAVLNPSGTARLWATWWGGCDDPGGTEEGNCLVLDGNDSLYVVGDHTLYTYYSNDPLKIKAGAYNDTIGTGFILKFNGKVSDTNTFGHLVWATNIGGNSYTQQTQAGLLGCAIDNNNNLFVTGNTDCGGYPVGYSGTEYSYGGNINAVIVKFDAATNYIDFAAYYGGSSEDFGRAIATDASGNAYMTGSTSSSPITPLVDPNPGHDYYQPTNGTSGSYNAFVAEFTGTGTCYWSTFLGGHYPIFGFGIALGTNNNIYITGKTNGVFPYPTHTIAGTYNQAYTNAPADAFVAAFDNQLQYVWGTPIGGNSDDIAFGITSDKANNKLYIVGETQSTNYPTHEFNNVPIQDTNYESPNYTGFITRFDLTPIPAGIKNVSARYGEINVFPNPTTGNIMVQTKLFQKQNMEFILYNTMGQIVYTQNLMEQAGTVNQEIDLSLLANGVYLLKVNEGTQYFTQKIVKQN